MPRGRLLPLVLSRCAPLLVWALQFALCYGAAAVAPDPAALRAPLLTLTALAAAVELWLLRRAAKGGAGAPVAALALIAVLWTGLPLLLL